MFIEKKRNECEQKFQNIDQKVTVVSKKKLMWKDVTNIIKAESS